MPPLGPLSSNPQPIVLLAFRVKKPETEVTKEFAHARPPIPVGDGTETRQVGVEESFPAATHWPAPTLRLPEPRSVPFFQYILIENDPMNVVEKSGGHPASTVPAPMT